MQTHRKFLVLLFISTIYIYGFTQEKVRFSQINNAHYWMGDQVIQLKPDYSKIVVTLKTNASFETVNNNLLTKFPLHFLYNNEEFKAITFEYTGSVKKSSLKKLFKQIQQNNAVSSVSPFYNLNGSDLYFFDVLNFKTKSSAASNAIQELLAKHDLTWLKEYESDYPGGISFARVPKGKSIFKISRELHASGLFDYIYPMSNRAVSEDYAPNDTEFIEQWHLKQSNDADIDAPEAWDLTTGNSNLVIAVMELNGFDPSHPDLSPNIIAEYNAFLDVNSVQYLDATHTHGTRVLGCSSASTDNNMGVAGVAFNLKSLPIVLTDISNNNVNAATLQRAADVIIANGNVVAISNSWSGSIYDLAEDEQFQRMREQAHNNLGAVVLGSTGNYSTTQIRYPACYKNVVGVGRTTQADYRYSSSNYHDSVDVSAPGSSILTTDNVGSSGASGDYTTASGTSFSTPIAAGVVGLMASINPSLTGNELKDFLEQSCEKVGNYPYQIFPHRPNGIWHEELGYGRINALTAVLLAQGNTITNDSCGAAQILNQITNDLYCYNNASINGSSASSSIIECNGQQSSFLQDAWFSFSAINSSMTLTVSPNDVGINLGFIVYDACNGNIIDCANTNENGISESIQINGLTINQDYFIQVYHDDTSPNNPSSFTFDVCAAVPLSTCLAPIGLSANSINDVSANLTWNFVSNAEAYEVQARALGSANWSSFLSNGSNNNLIATELACNSTIEWRVRSLCNDGGVSPWSTINTFATSDCNACYVPYNLSASNITSNSATLSWEANSPTCVIDGFDGNIYEGTANNGVEIDSWSDLTSNTFNVSGLQANTLYTFRVRHDCDCGGLLRSIYVYYSFITPDNTFIDLYPSTTNSNIQLNNNTIDANANIINGSNFSVINFDVNFYLSKSPFFNTFDYELATNTVNILAANSSIQVDLNQDLCLTNLQDDTYYLGYYIDPNQTVSEDNETNNLYYFGHVPIEKNCNTPIQYTLSLTDAGNTGSTLIGAGIYNDGVSAQIEAIPSSGWEFIHWTENGNVISTSANENILMNNDKSIVAHFGALTNIKEIENELYFHASPNPNNGKFTLQIHEKLIGSLCQIYSVNGQLISTISLKNIINSIDLSLSDGIYLLKIADNGEVKIVIQNN